MFTSRNRKGYTFIEISIVVAILAILTTISVVSLNRVQQNTYSNTSLEVLVSDLKLQQLKSMSGDTDFTGTFLPYGIYFGTNSYTLFRGSTYSAADPTNFEVELNPNLSFSNVEFASSQIIFTGGSGEISGFTTGNDTITLNNSISEEDTVITFNRYGVITNIQ